MITPFDFPILTALLGLCLGSFLHLLAYRIAFEKPILKKWSGCPSCNTRINWYDNIPVISWLLLRGQCRCCKASISWIYPFTELTTAILLTLVWHHMPHIALQGKIAYSIFIAALIISTASDLHTMTIPQISSIWITPIGLFAALVEYIPLSLGQSFSGALLGYTSLWTINFIFKKLKKIDGIGVGDMELFCMIGAFIGPNGLWHTILIASVTGSIIGIMQKKITSNDQIIIPFGPFLALGACVHLFLGYQLHKILTIHF